MSTQRLGCGRTWKSRYAPAAARRKAAARLTDIRALSRAIDANECPEVIAMVASDAANEIEALKKLVTLSRFAKTRAVRVEEIRRQLANARAMVPQRTGSAADDRFRAHEGVLQKFLNGASTKDALGQEQGITQDFLAVSRP